MRNNLFNNLRFFLSLNVLPLITSRVVGQSYFTSMSNVEMRGEIYGTPDDGYRAACRDGLINFHSEPVSDHWCSNFPNAGDDNMNDPNQPPCAEETDSIFTRLSSS